MNNQCPCPSPPFLSFRHGLRELRCATQAGISDAGATCKLCQLRALQASTRHRYPPPPPRAPKARPKRLKISRDAVIELPSARQRSAASASSQAFCSTFWGRSSPNPTFLEQDRLPSNILESGPFHYLQTLFVSFLLRDDHRALWRAAISYKLVHDLLSPLQPCTIRSLAAPLWRSRPPHPGASQSRPVKPPLQMVLKSLARRVQAKECIVPSLHLLNQLQPAGTLVLAAALDTPACKYCESLVKLGLESWVQSGKLGTFESGPLHEDVPVQLAQCICSDSGFAVQSINLC